MPNKKNIFFLMPSMGIGGAEKVLINLLNQFDFTRFNVSLIVAKGGGEYLQEVPREVKVQILFENKVIDKIARELYVKFGFSGLMKFYARKIRGDYDAGISFLDSVYTDLLFFTPAHIKKRIGVIQSSYVSYKAKGKNRKGKHMLRMKRRYSGLNTIVSVSNDAMEEFKSIFGVYPDMRVIYNPINFARVRKLAKENPEVEFDNKQVNLVAVGRLIPVKGYEMLINACRKIKDENIDFKLYIVGKGPLEDKLKAQVQNLRLENQVVITGFVKNAYSIMNIADIYLMTSYSEGLPTSLCEAMILEKPVLVTNASGCREVVDYGKYGSMVETDEESIASGIKILINDKQSRIKLSRLSAQRAEELFNDEKVMNRYYEMIIEEN